MVLILSNSAIDLHNTSAIHQNAARHTSDPTFFASKGDRNSACTHHTSFCSDHRHFLTLSIATRFLRAQTARMIFNYSPHSISCTGHPVKAQSIERYMGCTPLNQFFPGCDAEEMEVGRLVLLFSEYPRRGWASWTINMLTRSFVKLYWILLIVPCRHRYH